MEARRAGFGEDIINELRRIQQLELEALRRRRTQMQGNINVGSYDLAGAQTTAGLFAAPTANPAAPTGGVDGAKGGDTFVVSGDIIVDAKDKSPEELFALFLSAARKKSMAQYGTANRWSEVTQ